MKPSRSYGRHSNSSQILKAKDVAASSSCILEQTSELLVSQVFTTRLCLPPGWIRTLPSANHTWVSKALFKWSPEMQPEMDYARIDRMWWYPPFPPLTFDKEPELGCYFGHALFLWMPRKLWNVKLTCPRSNCVKEELTSAGLHHDLRQVVDVEGSYFIASECLVCGKCKRKMISWSHEVVSQLDIGHRVQYPFILASQMACDMKVVRLNRQRNLGTNISQIQKKLEEHHTEVWLKKTVQYLTDCKGFVHPVTFQSPPAMLPLPKHCWLRQVFALDVLYRMNEIKSRITSRFGRVLKMGSTKKLLSKFSRTWATSVANEEGQVIMSVITENKDSSLEVMISGLINRYNEARVEPPEVLYVNRDCCGSNFFRTAFKEWKDMEVRLDISEFISRISAGCTSESHQIYATFMNHLSHCIFKWDEEDLKQLKEAKRTELKCEIMQPSDDEVMHPLSKSELALHCRQTTHDVRYIEKLITKLIRFYDGKAGWDSLGVPLFNSNRMAEIWDSEKKHVECIVDPIGIQLYKQTGTLVKGDHLLPTYKSVRGSNCVENFHQHLNQLSPVAPTCSTFFQIYLLDALERWNETTAATSESLQETSSFLQHDVNRLGEEVFQQKMLSSTSKSKYTGELIGFEYLFRQKGSVFQDRNVIIRQMETTYVQVAKTKGYSEHKDVEGWTITQQSAPCLLEDSPSMISRSSQFQVEDLFEPTTSSLANENAVSVKEESMEYYCDYKPLISNLHPVTVMGNNNTTQEKDSLVQPAPAGTQSGLSLTLPHLLPGPSRSKQMMVVLTPFTLKSNAPPTVSCNSIPVPYTTRYYWKKKLVKENNGIYTRKYVRRSDVIQCRKCNKERIRSTHRQYYGNWYCQETETKPFAVWKAELLMRGYGRKKF